MVKRFALIGISLFAFLLSQSQPPSADKLMSDAYELAKKENKNIIVIFHASWCGWCHKMDKSMNDGDCKKLFDDNYITVHMVVDESKDKTNLETPGGDEFKEKYSGKDMGLPYWLVFDKDGNLLANARMTEGPEAGQNTGCPASEPEVNYFIKVLKKTSHLKDEELETIRKRFRKNEV